MLKLLIGSVVAAGVLWLAVVIVRFNLQRRAIARAAAEASDAQLEAIYRALESIGSAEPTGCILGRTQRRTDDPGVLIPIPEWLTELPWRGSTVRVTADREVEFTVADAEAPEPRIAGRILRAIAVPRVVGGSGTPRNVFSPGRCVAASPELRALLEEVCPGHPVDLLSYLVCVGRESFEFEPIDQLRIGAGLTWVQYPEFPSCPVCRKRMSLVLQVPGSLLPGRWANGTFYWFGCSRHPSERATVSQFT